MRTVVVLCALLVAATPVSAAGLERVPVEAADRFADGMAAVNAPICADRTALGVDPPPAARAELAYLTALKIRHVRDAFVSCYHQAAFDRLWHTLADRGVRLFATDLTAYTVEDVANARTVNPGVEAIGFGNEWDVRTFHMTLARAALAGDRTIEVGTLQHEMVPGERYRIAGDDPETFVFDEALSRTLGNVRVPLRFAHAAGTAIVRDGDFVDDVRAWLGYYGPRLRAAGLPVIGASLAFPIHAETFAVPVDRSDGGFSLDAVEEHGYPAPMGSNPEGPDGDGRRGAIAVDHPPCSFSHTSYSSAFDACEAARQTGRAGIPIWSTEYSYEVVPNGATWREGAAHAIPDNVGIAYLARSYLFAAAHGRDRLYWFQMLDGTDGPASGFCTYGLIDTASCDTGPPHDPQPKSELLTLGDLIAFFTDRACRYPACKLATKSLLVVWSDPAPPLETTAYVKRDGRLTVAAWLGTSSYDAATEAPCKMTYSCYASVAARSEIFTSPALRGAKSASVQTIDVDPRDPQPPSTIVRDALGHESHIRACPPAHVANFYGCLTAPNVVAIHNGSFSLHVSDVPQFVTFAPH